jgi:putative intracellular protease/amidase
VRWKADIVTAPSSKGTTVKVLFIITSHETGAWLSEITHPYWALAERDIDVDFASPLGGKIVWTPLSDPYGEGSQEPHDLVSKGFLADMGLKARLGNTLKLGDVDPSQYDAVHVAGGQGATYDLFPSEEVARVLEHFHSTEKVVGAICHGAIALGNVAERVRGRNVTGYSLEGDHALEEFFGSGFYLPNYPQKVLEDAGASYSATEYTQPRVIQDGRLVTGQNQQSASEYGLVLLHAVTGHSPVSVA